MKGFLSGIILGTAVSGLGLVAASRVVPVVRLQLAAPEAGAVAVPAGSGFNAERPDAPPILPASEPAPESATAPAVAAPEDNSDSRPDTTPLETPQAEPLNETGLTAPEVALAPVIVAGETSAPSPATEVAISQSDAPAVDPAPETGAVVPTPQTSDAPETPRNPETSVDTPETPTSPESVVDAPQAPASPEAVADAPPVAVPDAPQGLRLPVPEIGDMAPGVTTDRLPRIGASSPEPVEAQPEGMAMIRNAVAFDNASGNPLIAMVLLDVGSVRPDPAALLDFPLPLTVALDPTLPEAGALMRDYRNAGLEVAILTPLPKGAAPADVEVSFQSFLTALPEAVAVMDVPEAILQDSRPRAAQVVEILAASGHGLITYEKGLNTALQIASKSGVPAATVFRNIDPGDHDVEAMKRFLDQAAFRAAQDGRTILVAEARAETLTALAEWSLGNRAATVTFAPVSAVLGE